MHRYGKHRIIVHNKILTFVRILKIVSYNSENTTISQNCENQIWFKNPRNQNTKKKERERENTKTNSFETGRRIQQRVFPFGHSSWTTKTEKRIIGNSKSEGRDYPRERLRGKRLASCWNSRWKPGRIHRRGSAGVCTEANSFIPSGGLTIEFLLLVVEAREHGVTAFHRFIRTTIQVKRSPNPRGSSFH